VCEVLFAFLFLFLFGSFITGIFSGILEWLQSCKLFSCFIFWLVFLLEFLGGTFETWTSQDMCLGWIQTQRNKSEKRCGLPRINVWEEYGDSGNDDKGSKWVTK
jgi:hypothetical protein